MKKISKTMYVTWKKRNVQGGTVCVQQIRKIAEGGMEKFGTPDSSEKTIAIQGDRWRSQTAKQEGNKICERFLCSLWKNRNEHPNVGRVSIRISVSKGMRSQW